MDYRYGSDRDEIDDFFRIKRSWSTVKDKILRDYVVCYLKTVPGLRRPILIVDAFAGPGQFGDDSDGSPAIICKAISEQTTNRARASCLFSDVRAGHRAALERNLSCYIQGGITERPFEDCAQALSRALEIGAGSTIFFYLDPYGIKDLDFDMVRQIYERDSRQSTEVLINFNFRTFMRMSGNWNYGDSASAVAGKVKQSKVETVNGVMGGDYWREIVTDPNLGPLDRENAVTQAYLDKVREFFTYVYAVPVKERQNHEAGIPEDQLARYHLIFGTRSTRAVVYMNDVALNALDPYLRQFREGLLFDFTPARYQAAATETVKRSMVDAVVTQPLKRPQIYERIIPQYFMHRRKKDYRALIDELVFRDKRLYANPNTLKKANSLNDDTLISAKPWA